MPIKARDNKTGMDGCNLMLASYTHNVDYIINSEFLALVSCCSSWVSSKKREAWRRQKTFQPAKKKLVNFIARLTMHGNDDFSHLQKQSFPFVSWKNYEKRFILLLNTFSAIQYRKSPLFSRERWWFLRLFP